ncbi:MAG: NAD-dependent epimerase/dehydratase family protein [Deltaproteobacteria bacterium]|nr:NAD-dependent epimerase/dehydratase family protein [Deltaproteobacteria bacterium]
MPAKVALITGIAGGLARDVGRELQLRGFGVVGVDYRPTTRPLDYPATVYQANYNKTKVEDIFRRHQPSHVLHLGRVGNLKEQAGKRFDLNVVGSQKVMDLAVRYGARRLVVLSTFHIYGAHPQNHIPIGEDDPLRAGGDFPQIADAIQLDNLALHWVYRHPEVRTVLLRPSNVVGAHLHNAISGFLRQRVIPVMLGFDPMVQFIHADDLCDAVLTVTEHDAVGVFNVTGVGALPWREAVAIAGGRALPLPSSLAAAYLAVAGRFAPALPPYLVNFFKHPCIISDAALRAAFDWEPRIEQAEAVRRTVTDTRA